jgi:hypothetical protein
MGRSGSSASFRIHVRGNIEIGVVEKIRHRGFVTKIQFFGNHEPLAQSHRERCCAGSAKNANTRVSETADGKAEPP